MLGRIKTAMLKPTILENSIRHNLSGIAIADPNGKLIIVNHSFLKMWGYENEKEVLGRNAVEFWQIKEDPNKIVMALQKTKAYMGEMTGKRKDGSTFDAKLSASTIIHNEQILGMQASFQDITESRKAEKALRESDEIFGSLMKHSPVYVFFKDENVRSLKLSQNFETMLGRPMAELLGKNMDDLFPSELAKSMVADDMQVLNGGKEVKAEEKLNGRVYSTIKFPIQIEGKPRYLAGFNIDITESKKLEYALRESEEKYRLLFESSRDALMTLEPPSWLFTSGNKATIELFGAKSAKEFNSYTPDQLSPEKQPDGRASSEKAKEMIELAMRDGFKLFEWTHKRLNGEEFPATVLLTRTELGGRRFLQATVRDITERKLAEKQILELHKMEAFSVMAAGIAHDFNNMSQIIIGSADMLEQMPSPENIKLAIDNIKSAIASTKSLTSCFMEISNESPVKLQNTRIKKAIQRTIDAFGSTNRSIMITADLNVDPCVNMDEERFNRALLNLLVNSKRAMNDKDDKQIKISLFQNRAKVILEVSDNGPGVARGHQPKLWDLYFTTSQKGTTKGTGLGLSITKSIIEKHGGNIEYVEGKGATFRITLPISHEILEEAAEVKKKEIKGNGENILIIDDEEMLLELSNRFLKTVNFSPMTAANGMDGLNILKTQKADLVMLDLTMPTLPGEKVLQMIKKDHPTQKVIIVTGNLLSESEMNDLRKLGADGFLKKPYTIDNFIIKINEMVGTSKNQSKKTDL